MSDHLDGVRAKLHRAKENIVNLQGECVAFLNEHYRHDFIGEADPQGSKHLISYPSSKAPPARLAVLTGEVLYLLRSSLDHLVGQLVRLGDPSHKLNGVSFPICTDPRNHNASECGKVKGIPDAAAAAIMAAQPCYGRHAPDRSHALAILNTLNNRDKHRLLVTLVGTLTHIGHPDVQVTAKGMSGFTVRAPRLGTNVTLDHARVTTPMAMVEVFPITDGAPVEVAYVKVKRKLSFHISIEDAGTGQNEPLIPFLQHFENVTSGVVRSFERFFS